MRSNAFAVFMLAALLAGCPKGGNGGSGGGSGGSGNTGGGHATGGGMASTGGGTASTGGGSGGGSAGTCSPSTCLNGCCEGNSCYPPGQLSSTHCGHGGNACTQCGTNQTCDHDAGVCVTSMASMKFGDPCSVDDDCTFLGTGHKCKKMTTSGNGTYVDGYCTKICTAAGDCNVANAGAAVCIGLQPAYGESDRICWKVCANATDCRDPGYACYTVGANNACWISPLPSTDAGPPSDKIGLPCTNNAACSNPPDPNYAACVTDQLLFVDGGPSGIASGWPGGYCTASCTADNKICGDAGICLNGFPISGATYCAGTCSAPWAGQSSCRPGYVCEGLFYADGGALSVGYCNKSCFNDGGSCDPILLADGGQAYWPDGGPAYNYCDAGYCMLAN